MPYQQKGAALGQDMGVGFGLGNFWDDVYGVASKVAQGAQVVGSIVGGQNSVAVVPRGTVSIVPSLPGSPLAMGVGIPSWVLPVGGAALLYLLLRKR